MVVRKNNHTTTRRKFIFDFDSYEVQLVEKSYDLGYAPFKDLKIVRRVPACPRDFLFYPQLCWNLPPKPCVGDSLNQLRVKRVN